VMDGLTTLLLWYQDQVDINDGSGMKRALDRLGKSRSRPTQRARGGVGVSWVGRVDDGCQWDPTRGDVNSKEPRNAFTWKTIHRILGVS